MKKRKVKIIRMNIIDLLKYTEKRVANKKKLK